MKQISASILLLIFSGFLVCMSVDYRLYMKILNAGAAVEDVTSVPEEHHEKSVSDSKLKNAFYPEWVLLILASSSDRQYFSQYQFSLVENIYFDVPYSPPELG